MADWWPSGLSTALPPQPGHPALPAGELPPRRAARRPAESPRMEPRLAPRGRVPALLLCLGKPPPPAAREETGAAAFHLSFDNRGVFHRLHLEMTSLACESVCPSSRGCNGVGSGRRGIGIKKNTLFIDKLIIGIYVMHDLVQLRIRQNKKSKSFWVLLLNLLF